MGEGGRIGVQAMREIDLIRAEIIDTAGDLADCVKDYASLQVQRAEGIERCPLGMASEDNETKAANRLYEDLKVCTMREEEIRMKYKRLQVEYEIAQARLKE